MTYKRIIITEPGKPEVLEIVKEKELPQPDDNQVRIKVLTSSVAFTDTLIRRGLYPGIKAKLPYSPGYDMVGIIDVVGDKVEDFKIGDKVADLTVIGANSEYIIQDSSTLVPVPSELDEADAVSMILTYVTAHQMLFRSAKVKNGDTIFVHALGGAVGSAMLEIAKLHDIKVYGTASSSKHDYIKQLGGIPIDYHSKDFVQVMKDNEPNGVDAVFDPLGGPYLDQSKKIVKKSGTLVAFGFQNSASGGKGNVVIDFMKIAFWNLWPFTCNAKFYIISGWHQSKKQWFKDDLSQLFTWLKQGKLSPRIEKTIDFEDIPDAHRALENGEIQGKLILDLR